MWISVDVFGGDNAPDAILQGCIDALNEIEDMNLILFGKEDIIKAYFENKNYDNKRIRIVDAPEVIDCHEQPTLAIKRKKNSSLVRALECVRDGEAACMVSAGSTGAVLTGATLIVRRLNGVKRPALAPILPSATGCVLLIDCGANVDSKPEFLQQFAIMGSAYMENVIGIQKPRVALLNNGAEAEKGNALTKETYPLLLDAPINFVGNCEARDILSGDIDVLVCDGFAGNIVLKHTEGMAMVLMKMLKEELMSSTRTKIGAAVAKPAFANFKKKMDYTEYGGAPLLGINGGIIKAHGSSNAKAFKAALKQAAMYIQGDVTSAIAKGIDTMEEKS